MRRSRRRGWAGIRRPVGAAHDEGKLYKRYHVACSYI
jgi:hypothetical protein